VFSSGIFISEYKKEMYVSKVVIPSLLLNCGTYKVSARLDIPKDACYIDEQVFFKFNISEIITHSYGVLYGNEPKGFFHLTLEYQNSQINQ